MLNRDLVGSKTGAWQPLLAEEGSDRGGHPTLTVHVMCDSNNKGQATSDVESSPYSFKAKPVVMETTYANVESLDYEQPEDVVQKADQAYRTELDNFIYEGLKWLLCLMTAVTVAGFGIMVNFGVENISGAKFSWTLAIMKESYFLSFCVYATFNCSLVFLASCLVVYIGPAASGSGIPDVKAYLNGIDVPGVLLLRTLLTKAFGCICAVAGGLAVGKEGPFVHLGACVASLLTQGGPAGLQIKNRWIKMLANDRDRRDMVTCGGCAGVAGAFRAPVGGVLFALEEASSWWSNQVLWQAFFTTAVVSVSIRMMMKWCAGDNCGYFGSGGYIIFEISQGQVDYQLMELFPMLLLGLMGGVLGSTFNSINAQLCQWRRDVVGKMAPSFRVSEAVAVAFIGSLVSFVLPLMTKCTECPANAASACPRTADADHGGYIAFNCANPNEYNDLATLFFNTQDNAIRSLFSSNTGHEYSVLTLTVFFVFFYALAILTYGISVPSGLFVPSILCGAAYGRLVGMLMTELNGSHDIDEGTYALLGAASFLGGAMRMTVSLCVILLELTNNLNLLPLIMLVLLVAKAVGDATGVNAVYDIHVDLKKLPFLHAKAPSFMRHVSAIEAATPHPVSFQRVAKIRQIATVLQSCEHSGFPVFSRTTDGSQEYLGIILRGQLITLLKDKRAFQSSSSVIKGSQGHAFSFNAAEFSKEATTRSMTALELSLSDHDMEQFLDLAHFTNTSTYGVPENASLSKVYRLFRTLGLRHLVVIPQASTISGIITRKDLLPGMLERRFPEMAATPRGPTGLPRTSSGSVAAINRVSGIMDMRTTHQRKNSADHRLL